MAMKEVCVIAIFLPVFVLSAARGSSCTTPNGESATCVPLNSCKIIKDAIYTQNRTVLEFAKDSQCGYDSEPLVCCGTVAFKSPRGSSCKTPSGEKKVCKALSDCNVIVDAIQTRDRSAIDFAKASQCGYDTEPLVCCGSSGYPIRIQIAVSRLLPDKLNCGFEKDDNRVIGGNLTEIGEFPWMALLRYKYNDGTDAGYKCGGTVINERYVLTAAHCIIYNSNVDFKLDTVRLGEWNITSDIDCEKDVVNDECSDPVVDVGIEENIPNRQYNPRTGKHDIALLRLQRNIRFSDYIKPICLPYSQTTEPPVGTELVVAGWGATENSSTSEVKLKVKVPIVSRTTCTEKIRQRGPITEDQICAGGLSGKDSCQGDSGGPLMGQFPELEENRQQWYQEAVVAWGVGCGISGFPGVYTRVSQHIDWIINTMRPF